jgi:transcriptional regulator with XRE-family HTH domain
MANPVDEFVGKKLRTRRTLMGMSQEALGKEVGVSFQQIQKYERGSNRIGASRLYDFSRVLMIPVQYFFEGMRADNDTSDSDASVMGVAEPASGNYDYEIASSRETLEVVRAFNRIQDPSVRKRVFELVKILANDVDAEQKP